MSADEGLGVGNNAGGGNAAPQVCKNREELRSALAAAGDGGTVLLLSGKAKDFDFSKDGDGQVLPITAKKLTITSKNGDVFLQNVQFAIDLDTADEILIQDVVFRSDGARDKAKDAITIIASDPGDNAPASSAKSRVRISQCSFDGYADIAVDAKTALGRPQLLLTVDRCLFFDADAGQPGKGGEPFFNRGAINVASVKPRRGNALATIANNVYIDVWRRLPRVTGGNFAHIYNNLLYRWGYTKNDSDNDTWRGIEIGGGKVPTDNGTAENPPTDNGRALIAANRFIPWAQKTGVERELAFNVQTEVELSATKPNEFDGPNGTPGTAITSVAPATAATFPIGTMYTDAGATEPQVLATTDVQWRKLVGQAGSRLLDADPDIKRDLKKFLDRAAEGGNS